MKRRSRRMKFKRQIAPVAYPVVDVVGPYTLRGVEGEARKIEVERPWRPALQLLACTLIDRQVRSVLKPLLR